MHPESLPTVSLRAKMVVTAIHERARIRSHAEQTVQQVHYRLDHGQAAIAGIFNRPRGIGEIGPTRRLGGRQRE